MRLNDIKPGAGSRRRSKRRGRGAGSGNGKTAGRGSKGQKSRSGGGVRKGFEGGQMPLQRRLPKFGFASRKSLVTEKVRISALDGIEGPVVSLRSLRNCGLIAKRVKYAKLYGYAQLSRAYTVRGISASKGARASIESIGGKIED